jgi:guanosine-3',5'-bis(diphosphate) 3'-pyrophosphohydrolase
MDILERCIALALEAHRGQVDRYRRPYILHPLHLMMQMETEAEMMTAVLHDVVEDSDKTLADISALGVPPEVVTAVALLTHDKENVPYGTYIRAIKPNPLARRVKLADLEHNMDLRRIERIEEKDLARLQKYQQARTLLQEA